MLRETDWHEILSVYGLSPKAQLTLLRDAIDNVVYKISTSNQMYVARVSKSDKQQGMGFETELLEHLSQTVPVPQLVRTSDGQSHVVVRGQVVTLFIWLPGSSLEVDATHKPALTLVKQAGELLGMIHAASADFHPTQPPTRSINTEIQLALDRAATIEEQFEGGALLVSQLRECVTWEDLPEHRQGILHHDYIPSNLLIDKEQVTGVLDFDWSCIGPLGKEVGLALAIWSLPDGAEAYWADVYAAFLEGYNHTAPQPFADDEYLHHWIRCALLSETASFLNNLDAENRYVGSAPITRIDQCRRYKKFQYFSHA